MNLKPLLPIRRPLAALLALALAGAAGGVAAQALTPAFTYQGELRLASGPATAPFDMQFRLFSAAADGVQIGTTVTATNVPVTGGLFSVPLNFGVAQFAGERQWLEIAIRPAGTGTFETLSPRTEVTAAPYAWSAAVALANSVTTTSIVDGTIDSVDINPAQVQRRVTGTCPSGQYVRVVNADGTVTCGSDANAGGTVTSIATGAGLTGGPITATGTISVAPGGIGTTEINASQVQRRVTGTCTGTNYVQQVNADGTVGCGPAPVASAWSLIGNAGTNPTSNFIGTIDSQAFEIRTGNARSLRIEPSTITFGTPALPITTNTIGGSSSNNVTVGVRGATIGGGGVPGGDSDPDFSQEGPNRATDHYGTIGGGYANLAGDNTGSTSSAAYVTIAGGRNNTASGFTSTIGGGQGHLVSGGWSTISGGVFNTASGNVATIGGGELNRATGNDSAIGGGRENTASGQNSTIGGGRSNVASATLSAVGGGELNAASETWSTVGGGFQNTASGTFSTVGGGSQSTASGASSTVGGGFQNTASGLGSTVDGGRSNVASAALSAVGGGELNAASETWSTVGGGSQSTASGSSSTVGGGFQNTASGISSTVGGGSGNTASGSWSTVGGGSQSTASGSSSTVGGGSSNCAGGNFSWAGGRLAKVRPATDPGGTGACTGLGIYPGGLGDAGTFVWADGQGTNFVSTGTNQFLVRASGGAVITGNSATNSPAGNRLRVDGLLRVDALGTAAATTLCRNADNQISGCSSSARYKSDIADLELGLETALRLHAVGYRWKNTGDADVGFVAEEIAAIDERLVTRNAKGEVEGVKYDRLTAVLANAVQELAARDSVAAEDLSRVSAENAVLRTAQDGLVDENAAMRIEQDRLADENAALRARLAAIEARLGLSTGEER